MVLFLYFVLLLYLGIKSSRYVCRDLILICLLLQIVLMRSKTSHSLVNYLSGAKCIQFSHVIVISLEVCPCCPMRLYCVYVARYIMIMPKFVIQEWVWCKVFLTYWNWFFYLVLATISIQPDLLFMWQLDSTGEEEKTDTDKNMSTMFEILRRKKRVKLESLILNRKSFAQSVENLFALSFLVKDGRAEITVHENGSHLVCKFICPKWISSFLFL